MIHKNKNIYSADDPFLTSTDNVNQNSKSLDSIAEQWVNLVFAHMDYVRRNKQSENSNKKENKDGKTTL